MICCVANLVWDAFVQVAYSIHSIASKEAASIWHQWLFRSIGLICWTKSSSGILLQGEAPNFESCMEHIPGAPHIGSKLISSTTGWQGVSTCSSSWQWLRWGCTWIWGHSLGPCSCLLQERLYRSSPLQSQTFIPWFASRYSGRWHETHMGEECDQEAGLCYRVCGSDNRNQRFFQEKDVYQE